MKKVRITLACIFGVAMVVVFLMPGVFLTWWLGWITRLQLIPAILSGSLGVLTLLAVLVVLFGRLYCSVICPLGIAQDLFRGMVRICRLPFRRLPGGRWLKVVRLVSLAVFILLGCVGYVGVFEPYGIFGRFFSCVVLRRGSVAMPMMCWSLAAFALIVGFGMVVPRGWCNAHCPVGTFLGWFSRFAIFRVRVDALKCVKCGLCVKQCETGALTCGDDKNIKIDHSRCVVCGNCSAVCHPRALTVCQFWRRRNVSSVSARIGMSAENDFHLR